MSPERAQRVKRLTLHSSISLWNLCTFRDSTRQKERPAFRRDSLGWWRLPGVMGLVGSFSSQASVPDGSPRTGPKVPPAGRPQRTPQWPSVCNQPPGPGNNAGFRGARAGAREENRRSSSSWAAEQKEPRGARTRRPAQKTGGNFARGRSGGARPGGCLTPQRPAQEPGRAREGWPPRPCPAGPGFGFGPVPAGSPSCRPRPPPARPGRSSCSRTGSGRAGSAGSTFSAPATRTPGSGTASPRAVSSGACGRSLRSPPGRGGGRAAASSRCRRRRPGSSHRARLAAHPAPSGPRQGVGRSGRRSTFPPTRPSPPPERRRRGRQFPPGAQTQRLRRVLSEARSLGSKSPRAGRRDKGSAHPRGARPRLPSGCGSLQWRKWF